MQELSYRAEASRNGPLVTVFRRLQRGSPPSHALLAFLLVVGLITLLYQAENWRGKRAWQKCKHQLESKGAVLDWAALVPPAVPDSENVFEAPQVRDWFTGDSPNSFSERFFAANAKLQNSTSHRPVLAQLRIVSPETPRTPGQANLVIRYLAQGPAAFLEAEAAAATANSQGANSEPNSKSPQPNPAEVIPLITMDEVPLPNAIENVSRHGGLTCVLEPRMFAEDPETGEVPRRLPSVSIRLQNVTAEQALVAVLNKYSFELVPARQGQGRHVRIKDPLAPWLWSSPGLREALQRSLSDTLERAVAGAQGAVLLSRTVDQVQPVRIDIRSEQMPELAHLFPELSPRPAWGSGMRFAFEQVTTNTIEVRVNGPVYSAADYLAWSDQFKPEFRLMHEALKRPAARLAGNYRQLSSVPRISWQTMRVLLQTQAQRAQAHLLLGRPEAALEELSGVHELRRLWQTTPLDQITAMMNLTIAGMYVNVVADGLRLGVWQAPQLVVLQKQLQEINLPPLIAEALQCERVDCLQKMTLPADDLGKLLSGGEMTNLWQVFRCPTFITAKLAPQGWRCQNMILTAQLRQNWIDVFDSRRSLVMPSRCDAADLEMQNAFRAWSPRTCLAAALTVDPKLTWVRTAHAQNMIREAFVACALQRHKIAQGQVPERLDELVPHFIKRLPQDVLTGEQFSYRRVDNTRFLLYSPGWDLVDEGGVPERDWAWP